MGDVQEKKELKAIGAELDRQAAAIRQMQRHLATAISGQKKKSAPEKKKPVR